MKARGGVYLTAGTVVTVLVLSCAVSVGDPVPMTVQTMDFSDLGATTVATAIMESSYDYNGLFTGTVASQAFEITGGTYAGDYVYLYQALNAGPSVLENIAISPFRNIVIDGSGAELAGYLTDEEPAGFLAGGHDPLWMTWDSAIPSPVVSCNYPSGALAHVPAGDHTVAIFIVSPNAPTTGEIYVIDSGVATVDAVVPIPEPLTFGLLILGSVLTGLRKRRIIGD